MATNDFEFVRVFQAGYDAARRLPDGSIAAVGNLMFTRAIYVGCTADGWAKRFCYDDPALADAEYEALRSQYDVPGGYIARRPQE